MSSGDPKTYQDGYADGYLDGIRAAWTTNAPLWPGMAPQTPHGPHPVIPYRTVPFEHIANICTKCGMNFTGVMGYSCPVNECPIQAKGVCR